jgi:energy-coupling factor transporter ATP-binding protein EcfA2
VDSYKNLIELELGSPLTAHALLSGTTGSGKSTTLHMLIMSIIMKYHPDDVQLWLVDYKRVEFAEYIENTPPHVKLIGLERSKEFTCSLLDMIDVEFQRRAELFKQSGVSNITEYRNKGGKIPRVILIIDEFHQMTQVIQSEPHYSQILENILSEYRVFGLSCVFSDQAISVGLRGLTDKGKMQIRTRIAMSNDSHEIRETLALDSVFYDEDLKSKMLRMGVGDVIFKRMFEDDAGEAQIVFDKYKTVFVTKSQRVSIAEWVTKTTGIPKEKPLVIDGQHRSSFNQAIIDDLERDNSPMGKQIPLYIGTPASLNPCFCFFLREKIDSNIMVIGANDDLRAAVVYWSIYSFKRLADYKVYIFADKNDELFTQY